MHTEIGKIANMIQEVQKGKTPLQNKLDQLGKWLALAGGIAAVLVLVVGLLQGERFQICFGGYKRSRSRNTRRFVAVVTITLALGAQKC